MICAECKRPFTAVKDENICLDCAKQKWIAQQPDLPPPQKPTHKPKDGYNIYRVEWHKANGDTFLFIAVPPDNVPAQNLYLFKSNAQDNNELQIISNFSKGTTRVNDYTFRKIPECTDSITGTDRIDVAARMIRYIDNNTIYLKGGEYIRVLFR